MATVTIVTQRFRGWAHVWRPGLRPSANPDHHILAAGWFRFRINGPDFWGFDIGSMNNNARPGGPMAKREPSGGSPGWIEISKYPRAPEARDSCMTRMRSRCMIGAAPPVLDGN